MTVAVERRRKPGFARDIVTIARRSLRAIPRDYELVIPSLIVPAFFFVVNIAALERVFASAMPQGFDYRAFQIPTAISFAVTGVSRANTVVVDIQTGYFNRLLLTPVHRLALLLGLMIGDFVMVVALTVPVLLLGFAAGVEFDTGVLGVVVFGLISGLWGLAFAGFPYAIALRTGNPGAVNTSFVLFFPFLFLTTAFAPEESLSGWLGAAADVNPVTYLLAAQRSLLMEGWDGGAIASAIVALLGVGAVSYTLALLALRGRVRRA